MERLTSCEIILCEGTVRTAPDPYLNIYIIFGDFKNCKIPLVFALLTGKTSDHYKLCLKLSEKKFTNFSNQIMIYPTRKVDSKQP